MGTAIDHIWRARGGVLRHRARRVRRHVFEDSAQPVDDVVVVHDVSSSPVYSYPRVSWAISGRTLRFMKLKATCSALSSTSLKALIFGSSSGSWITSCIGGSEFHHDRCFGCFPLGFGNSGWWLVM
jgi:hypothetical protein